MSLQLAAPNTVGATCQTVAEARVLAELGCDDVLLTNQLVDPGAARTFVALPDAVRVAVLIDRPEQVNVIGTPALAANRPVDVYVELDVGLRRGGFAIDDPDLEPTVAALEAHSHLILRGVQAYEGHAVLEPDEDPRRHAAGRAHRDASTLRDHLSDVLGRRLLLTGGGTGTADLAAVSGMLDEVQCGSYALMDVAYSQLSLGFEPALFCVATVLSAHPDGRVVLDAGMKTMSGDGLPVSLNPHLKVLGLSDEHTRAQALVRGAVATGQRTLLQPWHVDPTMNLNREFVMIDEGEARPSSILGHHALGSPSTRGES